MRQGSDAHGGRDTEARLVEILSGLDADQRARVLGGLGALAGYPTDPFEPVAPPSGRRPRRADVVTYRVRVDLMGTKPPLWRRLELASDLHLDDLHDILQVAFGWTDSHLHRFAAGPSSYGPDTEYYLCPYDVAEGDEGVPEDEVRLDEVLVEPGDRLFYSYDYGDDWQHTIKLEAIRPRQASAPRAACTAGRRDGPPENCGGVHGYELIAAAVDPTHPHHAELAAEFDRHYGGDIDPAHFDATPFDLDQINAELGALGLDTSVGEVVAPGPLADLLKDIRVAPVKWELRRLIAEAALDAPVSIDADTAARMVAPYTWLLNRVGEEGIALTAAGYLPPDHVTAAIDALGLDEIWIGKGNREHLTGPVLHLRESAQKEGLVRKHRGRLVLTARGRDLRTDPQALWWHLAERMPPRSRDASEVQAGLVFLIAVAAQTTDRAGAIIANVLDAIGWTSSDRTRLTAHMAARAAWDTKAVLRRLGALPHESDLDRDDRPTTEGVTFARAALSTWPDRH